jgi:hypothetical protein
MKPEDIRRLYREEDPATQEEARKFQEEARTDPAQARRLLLTIYALGGEDPEFARLLDLVLKVGIMQLIVLRAQDDDKFALQIAETIIDAMEQLKPGSRVRRGKPKQARTA